jgi:hypothetical protein
MKIIIHVDVSKKRDLNDMAASGDLPSVSDKFSFEANQYDCSQNGSASTWT